MKKCLLILMAFFLLTRAGAQEDSVAAAPLDSAAVLPLDSVAFFQVQAVDKVILLKWAVTQSGDYKSFDIERADDGVHFFKVGSKLAISKGENESYDFVDATPKRNIGLRYRLKLISKDGFATYSVYRETKMGVEQLTVRLKQNPVRNTIDLELEASTAKQATVAVVSQAGQQVAVQTFRLTPGLNQLSLSTQSMLQGIYQLVVEAGTDRKTISFIKE